MPSVSVCPPTQVPDDSPTFYSPAYLFFLAASSTPHVSCRRDNSNENNNTDHNVLVLLLNIIIGVSRSAGRDSVKERRLVSQ